MRYKPLMQWMVKRHEIWKKREAGDPPPWTEDEILRKYKFTNVFRDLDRVSIELINVLNNAEENGMSEDDMLFNIIAFRIFNWPETYKVLCGDEDFIYEWDEGESYLLLEEMKKSGKKMFTGAYMVTNNGKHKEKWKLAHESLCEIHSGIVENNIGYEISKYNSIQHAWNLINPFPMMGNFVSYEMVTDLTYTYILRNASDILTWANAGPGAIRGINRLLGKDVKARLSEEEALRHMRWLLKKISNNADFGRDVVIRDIEHSLCEFDKYERVRKGEGRPRSLYHAKV